MESRGVGRLLDAIGLVVATQADVIVIYGLENGIDHLLKTTKLSLNGIPPLVDPRKSHIWLSAKAW